MRKLET